MNRIDQLHNQAINLMTELDAKYNMDNLMSLDEYLYEYCDLLTNNEQLEVSNLLNEFNKYY